MWYAIVFVCGLLWGSLLTSMWYHRHTIPSSTDEEHPMVEGLRSWMQRIVNLEELEEHEKLTKLRMERNRRKTTRVDSGANARVMRMRLTRRPRR